MFSSEQKQIIGKNKDLALKCLIPRAIDAGRYDLKAQFTSLFPDEDIEGLFDITHFYISQDPVRDDDCKAFIENFPEFKQETILGETVEQIYHLGREVLVSTSTDKEKYLIYKEGDFYNRTVTYKNDVEEVSDNLIASLDFKIRNMYSEISQTIMVYRLPLDRKDRIEELQSALDTIKATAFLTVGQTNALWKLLTTIAPEFLELNQNVRTEGVTIHNGIIQVTVDPSFIAKSILTSLSSLYDVVVDKNAFNFMFLYSMFLPFAYEFRKRNFIVPYPLYYGGGGVGKSALTRKFIVKGLNNPNGDLTEQDVYTLASFRNHMSSNTYPKFIDEVSMEVLLKYASHLKAMTTGKGTSSRGKRLGGNNQWETTATPVFVSNEYISDQYAFNRRAYLLLAEGQVNQMNPAKWRKYSNNLPDGFLYLFLDKLNGISIEDFVEDVVGNVTSDEEYIIAYLTYMLNIVRELYKEYDIPCPFELPHRDEAEYRWEEIMKDYLVQQRNHDKYGEFKDKNKLIIDMDYRYFQRDGYVEYQLKRIGYEKFLNMFPRCPYKDLKTFAINASTTDFKYKQLSWDGSSQRILLVKVYDGLLTGKNDIITV